MFRIVTFVYDCNVRVANDDINTLPIDSRLIGILLPTVTDR